MINDLRISGLASGMDTESIIQKLMKAERMPLNSLIQQRQQSEWRQEAYRDMNKLLLDLRNSAFDMKLQGSYGTKTTTSSDPTVATATATSAAGNSTYTLGVTALATAASNQSATGISLSSTSKIDPNSTLWSVKDKFAQTGFKWKTSTQSDAIAVDTTNTGTTFYATHDALIVDASNPMTVNVVDKATGSSKAFTVYTDQASFNTANQTAGTNNVLVDTATGKMTFNQTIAANSTIDAKYTYNTKTFDFSMTTYDSAGTAQSKTFTVDGNTQSLNSALSLISNDATVGVSAFYDSFQDKVVLTRKASGDLNTSGKEILVGTSGGFLNNVLKIDETNETGGTNASFTLNGLATQRTTNNFTINGVTFDLKKISTSNITISVNNDVDATFDKIKAFVDKYNEIIGKINDKLREKQYRDYKPLTDDQKKDMKDRDIELWEEKAKSGLLHSDTILSGGLNQFRLGLSDPVAGLATGAYDQLSDIGITTGAYQDKGKLYIDEAKLKDALTKNPDQVMNLFTKTGTSHADEGIALRLYDDVNKTMDKVTNKAGSTLSFSIYDNSILGKEIRDYDTRIRTFEDRLKSVENRYYRQFSAMEKAISQSNSQSAWLASQLGGGQG